RPAKGWRPNRATVGTGIIGRKLSLPVRSNSVYIHLISMTPVTSVFRPALAVSPPCTTPAAAFAADAVQPASVAPAAPTFLPGPPPQALVWPYVRSISSPRTALVRPTS